MNIAFLKPVGDATIISLRTGRPIPPEGEKVALENYYKRRVMDGDAVIVEDVEVDEKPATAKTQKSK